MCVNICATVGLSGSARAVSPTSGSAFSRFTRMRLFRSHESSTSSSRSSKSTLMHPSSRRAHTVSTHSPAQTRVAHSAPLTPSRPLSGTHSQRRPGSLRVLENTVHKTLFGIATLCALFAALTETHCQAQQAMAPLAQYLISDRNSEIALARTAAPSSISAAADVMVLTPSGYVSAAKGTNGFLCMVERSWGADSVDPEFWNPRVRSPICFNPPAAQTVAPFYVMKTRLV